MPWLFPPQWELDLLLDCMMANVATFWTSWYRKEFEAKKTMRCLALAYNE